MPYRRGPKWMAQIRINGKLQRKTFLTKSEAIEWEVSQRKQQQLRLTKCHQISNQSKTITVSLIKWAEDYLDFSLVKHSNKTFDEKRSLFKRLFQSIDPEMPIDQLTPGIILQYLQLQAKNRSGYAANKDRKNLVAAWNWGIKYHNFHTPNPCLVDRFPEVRSPRYVPPEEDFWKVFNCTKTQQDKTMLLAYIHLGARRSELFALKWQDVSLKKKTVFLYTRKSKDGSVEFSELPLTNDLLEALSEHHKQRCNEWVFPDPESRLPYLKRQHWMGRLCKRAGVKKFGFHGIRHLTASILAQQNVAMIDIQTILRHKNLATTERYIRRLGSVRSAMNLLPST